MNDKKGLRIFWLIFACVAMLGLISAAWFLAIGLSNQVRNTLNPLQQANNQIGTQVANLLNPTPTILPDPVTIIHDVRSMARLETIQYTVEKVITAEVHQGIFGPLFGDRLLFVAHGYVIAGIDLEKINDADLWLSNNVLHIKLPPAEIFVTTLNNEQSYVYDRDTGLLTRGNIDLESMARMAAEAEIRSAAEADGILQIANQNAEVFLEKFFGSLGYHQVVFEK